MEWSQGNASSCCKRAGWSPPVTQWHVSSIPLISLVTALQTFLELSYCLVWNVPSHACEQHWLAVFLPQLEYLVAWVAAS